MEEALKEAFGTDRALLDWGGEAASAFTTKVAVTATTTDTSTACVFANYGGEGNRPVDCGKCQCFSGECWYLGSPGYKNITLPNDQKTPIWKAYGPLCLC